jgi:hypothetical protein
MNSAFLNLVVNSQISHKLTVSLNIDYSLLPEMNFSLDV